MFPENENEIYSLYVSTDDGKTLEKVPHITECVKKQIMSIKLPLEMLIVCKDKKIVIYKCLGKEFKIQCHEEDEFDWSIGFGLALSQAYGKRLKWKTHREYYRNKERKLDYKKYSLWCIMEYFNNDVTKLDKLDKLVKEINENGKVDL